MNITVNSTTLAQELRLLNQIVATKPPLPILMNVLVQADDTGLHFKATDLEISFSTQCAADIFEHGLITLPAKRFLDIIEQCPDGDVQITTDRSHVHLRSGAFRGRLQTLDADDFPTVPFTTDGGVPLPTIPLQTMVRRVRYAISDKGKYTLSGAYFSLTENSVGLVATDGKRLVVTTMSQRGMATTPVIVPAKTLDALMAMFTEPQVLFSCDEKHLFFQTPHRQLASRMLEGQFPNWQAIIPKNSDKIARVDRALLAAALRRVGLVAEESQACYFSFEDGALEITSSSAEVGDAVETVSIEYSGQPVKVCCSWRYVLDFLEAAGEPMITVSLQTPNSPMLLTDGHDHIAVVMVMRVR